LRSSLRVIALAFVCASSGLAHAFVDAAQFFDPADSPHGASLGALGEGVYFTGAPRYSGLDCSTCHTDGPQQISVRIGADPPGLFSEGYEAGTTYELLVEIIGEGKGLDHKGATCTEPPGKSDTYAYQPCNNNNFALELDDINGPLASPSLLSGTSLFCPVRPTNGICPTSDPISDETVVAPGGDAIFGNRMRVIATPKTFSQNDPTRWRFYFTAPIAGTGPLTLYLGAVDGNGGDGSATNDQDPYGDDTVRATVPMKEANALAAVAAVAGCAYAGSSAQPRALSACWVLLCIGFIMLRRRCSGRW